jgi:primosomal protein N' (replication factor Y)
LREGAKRDFARQLRGGMTDAEQRLWRRLRHRQLEGCRFRRQHPIGPYIVDFACLDRRLVVEVDGGGHGVDGSDESRDAWFRDRGYCVLRFWNNDVLLRTDDAVEEILKALATTSPHPDLPPQAGEGVKA